MGMPASTGGVALRAALAIVALLVCVIAGCMLTRPWWQTTTARIVAQQNVAMITQKSGESPKAPTSRNVGSGVGRASIFLAAAAQVEEQAGKTRNHDAQLVRSRFEWEVVFPGDVRVRSSKSLNSESNIIGTRLHGSVLFGYEEDGWLKLFNERGYVAIVQDDEALLQARNVSYSKIRSGKCGDFGFHVIPDLWPCEAAAATLGLSNLSIIDQPLDEQFNSAVERGGCCLKNGKQVTLKADLDNLTDLDSEPICSTREYRPLLTNTSLVFTDTSSTSTLTPNCNQCEVHEYSKPSVMISVFERDLCKLKVTVKSIAIHDKHGILGDLILCWVSRHPSSEYASELEEIKDEIAPSRNVSVEEILLEGSSGWLTQQMAKLKIASKITSEFYIVLDAKDTFISDIMPTTFFTECNQGKIFGMYSVDEMPPIHTEQYRSASAVLGVQPISEGMWPASITPVVMHRQTVLDLLDTLGEPREFGRCVGGLCDAFSKKATEFTLYYTFVNHKSQMDCIHNIVELSGDHEITVSVWRIYDDGSAETAKHINMGLVHTVAERNESAGWPLVFGSQAGALDMVTGRDHYNLLEDLYNVYSDAGLYDFENWDDLADCVAGH